VFSIFKHGALKRVVTGRRRRHPGVCLTAELQPVAAEETSHDDSEIKKTTEGKMDQSIASFKNNLTKIRTGRANPALLDTVQVDYYGTLMPISQVANVSLLDARTISVQPWEKGMGAKIEKAIRESDLGLNPASMGT
jgi:ribosome recycling factor